MGEQNMWAKIPVILGMAACVLADSGAAEAETIYLRCTNTNMDMQFAIDLTNNTVDGNPATITPILFHWVRQNDNGSSTAFNIDRTTGTLTLQGTIPGVGQTGVVTEACTAESAPATKF
jgi:hypothetical protein